MEKSLKNLKLFLSKTNNMFKQILNQLKYEKKIKKNKTN